MVVVCLLGSASLLFGAEETATCPVMKGMPVKPQYAVEYQGKKIGLCCASCVKAFKKNPAKYR